MSENLFIVLSDQQLFTLKELKVATVTGYVWRRQADGSLTRLKTEKSGKARLAVLGMFLPVRLLSKEDGVRKYEVPGADYWLIQRIQRRLDYITSHPGRKAPPQTAPEPAVIVRRRPRIRSGKVISVITQTDIDNSWLAKTAPKQPKPAPVIASTQRLQDLSEAFNARFHR